MKTVFLKYIQHTNALLYCFLLLLGIYIVLHMSTECCMTVISDGGNSIIWFYSLLCCA